jgi:hypothetical protein
MRGACYRCRVTNGTLRRHACLALAVIAAALAGCASAPHEDRPSGTDIASRCERAYRALDDAIATAGVRDAMSARVPGFPYLRVDRLHASFATEALASEQLVAWIAAMQREDVSSRLVEIGNLPPEPTASLQRRLAQEGFAGLPPSALLEGCSRTLAERDIASPARIEALRAAARVPDDYSDALRAAGAYPLTAPACAIGVRRYEAETREAFAQPVAALPQRGTLHAWVAGAAGITPGDPREQVRATPRDALGIPRPTLETLDALFAAWAPRFEVDEADVNDRLGMPVLDANDRPTVDAQAPVVFARAVATRFDGRVLLQLVYTAWFPARPAQHPGDVLAGHMDGLVWRVTLDDDGSPLLFDSIHACGCYQLFFPTGRLAAKPTSPGPDEGALVAQTLPAVAPGTRLTLRVESGTHYLRRVIADAPRIEATTAYAISPDDRLRTLPRTAGGTRSLYGEDGRVPGTERAERLLLWPLGIESAGAMRQWGRHATAFIGRQHFDEAFLIQRYFERAPGGTPRVAADAGGDPRFF